MCEPPIILLTSSHIVQIYNALCPNSPSLKPRFASLRTLYEPLHSSPDRQILDSSAIVLFFPAPQSVTGEDVIEFHIHGGPAVVKAVLAAIPKTEDPAQVSSIVRYAEPGEFTKRAFYNHRLDLTQIEALGDTLAAETEQQHRLAARGTHKSLTERYESWRRDLLYARGELEALIDFSEDQHFEESPAKLVASVADQVQLLSKQIQSSIGNALRGELLRNGINIALLGAPNAGKSSLLNAIVGREAAIVSQEAGTTRDVVEVNVDIGGYFCKFGDLAGLRGLSMADYTDQNDAHQTPIGEVEKEGMRRAKQRIVDADVVILVMSYEASDAHQSSFEVTLSADIIETLGQCDRHRQRVIHVVNKMDLVSSKASRNGLNQRETSQLTSEIEAQLPYQIDRLFPISCKKAEDTRAESDSSRIQALLDGLISTFREMTEAENPSGESAPDAWWSELLGASERQRLLLVQCHEFLTTFLSATSCSPSNEGGATSDVDVVLAAESLRAAADCLAKITGRGEAGDIEEVLGVIFEKYAWFC